MPVVTEVRRSADDPALAVVRQLGRSGALTRSVLGERTGLSRTTVSGLLGDLRRRGLVDEVAEGGVATGGRTALPLALTPRAGVAVGVDVGRTHVTVAVVDGGHRTLAARTVPADIDHPADVTLTTAADLVGTLLGEVGATCDDVLGVGLGVPAPLDRHGRVGSSSLLPSWVGLSPADVLGRRLGVPVRAENDANLGALAEAVWGAARGAEVVVYIKASTGIGAGIVLDGQLFRGATGTAGEVGHTTVTDGGDVCRCGNRGCLELVAGGAALVAQLGPAGVDVAGVIDLVELARRGDPGCRRVLADAGDHLGVAVANLVNVLNPDVVVFGGELGVAGDLVLGTLRTRLHLSAPSVAGRTVKVVPGVLGNRAESVGGALLVLRELDVTSPPVRRLLAG